MSFFFSYRKNKRYELGLLAAEEYDVLRNGGTLPSEKQTG